MSRARVRMRGLKVCAIGCDGRDAQHLQQQFARLGVEASFHEHFPPPAAFEGQQLVIFDGDNSQLFHPTHRLPWPELPKIVLTAMETPSRLQWIIEQQISGYMRKPVRFDGVMTAFTLALASDARQQELTAQLQRQEERLKARRFLFSAQLLLMQQLELDEDSAYSLLRRMAMQQQKTVEHFSIDLLANRQGYLALAKTLLAAPGG
ncbi:ANTAR domain-containing protein [Erwiniaceae bacterium BAC15a-03b]|uniref:ANTAR domain-containing protein n=1 Tax=Winslowiella arboricola TaxID=2978220 RepID=A0A9J6PJE8_9GAMM|nr:ANTAR domain-containing protein [Winslowiella arboricola]MCU5773652.1 ANTAR domain-containing protein [Winslowiella arboricola]MCU5778449.1 ANTAR domain-containing protein [Winslowiella arboricola]